jgi:hypothetical protein
VIATPNTTVTILGVDGGDATPAFDAHGDVVEPDAPETMTDLDVHIPAHISTRRQVATTESDLTAHVITYYAIRLPRHVQVDETQRLRDDNTGQVYIIDSVTRSVGLATPADTRVDAHTAD